MKIRVLRNSFVGCPDNAKTAGFSDQSVVHLTIGSEREVHAVSFFSCVLFLLVLDDLDFFVWLPAWLFEVLDGSLPSDWIIGVFNDDPVAVIGPRFVAESLESYTRMVEEDPRIVSLMRDRIAHQI
jgi:hypothetical protein